MTTITLAQIARSVKLSPKTARRILRNSKNVPKTVSKERWVFPTSARRQVVAILTH